MGNYEFWVHGTSVQVQMPERAKRITRIGSGTFVGQDKDFNWFHFPIPTPAKIDDDPVVFYDAYIYYTDLVDAKFTAVHIYDGDRRFFVTGESWQHSLTNDTLWLDIPDCKVQFGAVVCAKVDFLKVDAHVRFNAVGLRFDRMTKSLGRYPATVC